MAAEVLASAGIAVSVHEAMPTVARKFLLAGKSGLNITHSESHEIFRTRYGDASGQLRASLDDFPAAVLRHWADDLGAETFTGSSGRVFPRAMKGSPLLRAWLARLKGLGVAIHTRHRWLGLDASGHRVMTPEGEIIVKADAALLAFGGASWPRLGSDGGWVAALRAAGVAVNRFRPANCGFDVDWSVHFAERHAGHPVKAVVATSDAGRIQGEFVIGSHGVEGSLIYAHSAALRDRIEMDGFADLLLDLAPGRSIERIAADLARQPGKLSLSNRLRKGAGLDAVKSALVRECLPDCQTLEFQDLAKALKALPVRTVRPRPLEEAISSAGGVEWDEVGADFMLRRLPGLFVAGEMIDWEAPTGGYLLTACFATGRAAGKGIQDWLSSAAG